MRQTKCILFNLFFLSFLFACEETGNSFEPTVDFWEANEPFELDYSAPFGLARTDRFAESAEARGESDLIEASGIVVSIANPGYIWTHEDKNNTNEIFLLDAETGETVASYELQGIFNRDWEDIEIGPGPVEGTNYIYLGEVGDNDRVYRDYKIYRFVEPVFSESHRGNKNTIQNAEIEIITFEYPDRLRHDVETLLLDPWTKDLFLVTKRDFFSIIYVLPYPQSTDEPMEAIKVGEFPFTRAVGGNISLDGKEMLIKTYDFIFHWERNENEDMVEFFTKIPKLAPYNPAEPQGEAICFDENKGYYTLSEFSNAIVPVLYYYERLR
ncbi:hypothetical protein [Arthrospiribacter ruber]|uniref:Lipoprotein n=1 Tax=Arthrospiribacter ruber TaxID=2487934 RepID=A0A951J1V0_9BACT|nr:hypothetical protein [Arthrospiribacter ruber]MBW3469637.1 hypothetical protein [Arthrospiribacter ruber]